MGLYRRRLQPRLLNATMSNATLRDIRERVCLGLFGDILEVGYGSGLNQPHLPGAVSSVSAVEPSALAYRLAGKRRSASPVPVTVIGDDAQDIAAPDDEFDAALCTWSLCGIPDPAAALREIRRVLKPGGQLHFVEHGLTPDASVARLQRRFDRINRLVAGCVLDLDVPSALGSSGLTVESMRTYYEPSSPRVAGYCYEGRAVA